MLAGKECPYYELAHPAIESYGINVFETAKKVDYKIFWIDEKTKVKDVPYGSRVGLVLYD